MQDEHAPEDRSADNPQRMPEEETQRMPAWAPEAVPPWKQEPARRDETAPPAADPPGGGVTTSFSSAVPGVPSPYESPPLPAVPPASPPTAPPLYTPPSPYGPTPAYTPPPVYGPTPGLGGPPGGYGGYGAAPIAPPANSTALAAMVCGILAIVLACSAGPLGAIMGGISLFLVSQYSKQRQQNAYQMANPSDVTYVQVGRVTGIIGLIIGGLYTLFFGCYLLVIFAAIIGSSASGSP